MGESNRWTIHIPQHEPRPEWNVISLDCIVVLSLTIQLIFDSNIILSVNYESILIELSKSGKTV